MSSRAARPARSSAPMVALAFACLSACSLLADLDGLDTGSRGDGGVSFDGADAPAALDGEAGSSDAAPEAEADAALLAYREAVLADKPIFYLPFDEPAGAMAIADVAGQRSASTTATIVLGEPGVAGTGARFVSGPPIDFGDILDLGGEQPMSLEVWVKPEVGPGVEYYEFLNKRQSLSNGWLAFVRRAPSTGEVAAHIEFDFVDGGRGGEMEIDVARFHHVVFTFGRPGGLRMYLDGVAQTEIYDNPGGPQGSAVPLRIGNGYRGWLDELAVYDHVLSPERVLAHLALGRP